MQSSHVFMYLMQVFDWFTKPAESLDVEVMSRVSKLIFFSPVTFISSLVFSSPVVSAVYDEQLLCGARWDFTCLSGFSSWDCHESSHDRYGSLIFGTRSLFLQLTHFSWHFAFTPFLVHALGRRLFVWVGLSLSMIKWETLTASDSSSHLKMHICVSRSIFIFLLRLLSFSSFLYFWSLAVYYSGCHPSSLVELVASAVAGRHGERKAAVTASLAGFSWGSSTLAPRVDSGRWDELWLVGMGLG